MKIINCVQLSGDWWDARRGIPSASRFDQIVTPAKGEYSKSSRRLIAELIGELGSLNPKYLTENPTFTRDMAHGRDTEPEARNWFAMTLPEGWTVETTGLVVTDDGRLCCSPDGLVRDETGKVRRGLELKCPNPTTHAEYLMDGQVVPTDYKPQVHGSLFLSGLEAWDFVSYHPGLEPIHVTVRPDDYTLKVGECLKRFCQEYAEARAKFLPGEAKVEEALEQWSIRLDACQSPDQLTASLPLLADLREWPEARRKAWGMVKAFADSKGWVYNDAHKAFHLPQPVPAGAEGEPDW